MPDRIELQETISDLVRVDVSWDGGVPVRGALIQDGLTLLAKIPDDCLPDRVCYAFDTLSFLWDTSRESLFVEVEFKGDVTFDVFCDHEILMYLDGFSSALGLPDQIIDAIRNNEVRTYE